MHFSWTMQITLQFGGFFEKDLFSCEFEIFLHPELVVSFRLQNMNVLREDLMHKKYLWFACIKEQLSGSGAILTASWLMVFFGRIGGVCFGGDDKHEILLAATKGNHIVIGIPSQRLHGMLIQHWNSLFTNRHPQNIVRCYLVQLQEKWGWFQELKKYLLYFYTQKKNIECTFRCRAALFFIKRKSLK